MAAEVTLYSYATVFCSVYLLQTEEVRSARQTFMQYWHYRIEHLWGNLLVEIQVIFEGDVAVCLSRMRGGLEHHVSEIFDFLLIRNPVLILKNFALFLLVEALLLAYPVFSCTLRSLMRLSVNFISFERNVGEDYANILLWYETVAIEVVPILNVSWAV